MTEVSVTVLDSTGHLQSCFGGQSCFDSLDEGELQNIRQVVLMVQLSQCMFIHQPPLMGLHISLIACFSTLLL